MKTTISFKQIRKVLLFISVAFACIVLATSCKKDSGGSSSDAVSQDDAAETITQAVTPESGGMVAQVDNSVTITANYTLPCGESFDSSISATNPVGSLITYSFNLAWNWMLKCSTAEFDFNFKGSSMYDAPRMSSNDSSNGSLKITGLETSKTNYVVNTSYVRNGSQQSKILNKNSFTSKINIASEDIMVDKATQEIISGTASVSISGASTSGKSFSYDGAITFNGNKSATLVLGNGNTYSISW